MSLWEWRLYVSGWNAANGGEKSEAPTSDSYYQKVKALHLKRMREV